MRFIGIFEEEALMAMVEDNGGLNIDEQQGYDKLNDCVKELVKKNPFCAHEIKENMHNAFSMEYSLFGNFGLNDCSDAFRHSFFNA